MGKEYIFTSESVSEGHPDKMADQISDAILDTLIKQDQGSRVACETLVKSKIDLTNGNGANISHKTVLAGEVSTSAKNVDYEQIARNAIKFIGYDSDDKGFNWRTCEVETIINEQSPDISRGVAEGDEQGAGDQGLMFGFACDETDVLMPWPITYAHRLVKKQAELRKTENSSLKWLGPDAKSQVSVVYDEYQPLRVHAVVLSTQHDESISQSQIREAVIEEIIKPVIPANMMPANDQIHVNPTGKFVDGGPKADCGLTGRKIIVDTYGGMSRHGGGAFSGKDPSKVDRSAAYLMRYVAKNVVAAGLAKRCEVQVSYAIGVAKPISLMINTFGTGVCDDAKIADIVSNNFDLRPAKIIETLDLLRPIYQQSACYGHFGRAEPEFSWENTDVAPRLREAAGLSPHS